MAWVWTNRSYDDDPFQAVTDYKRTTVPKYRMEGPEPLAPDAGAFVLKAASYGGARVRRYGCLPAAGRNRVVHKRLVPVIAAHAAKMEYQLFPVTVTARGGEEIKEFFALIPLNEVDCTDVDKSEITEWIVPGEVAQWYRSIVHHENCLGQLNIGRDKITGHVVVSESLKAGLEATGEPGVWFCRPEEMRTPFS